MEKDTLPEWTDVMRKIEEAGMDSLDPVEKFIYNNEPADPEEAKEFRNGLQEALEFY